MVGWNHDNARWRDKECLVCSSKFKPRSGVHKFCSETCKGKWKYLSGHWTTENQYSSISGNWDRYAARLVAKKDRKALSKDFILNLLLKQDYKCALSGLPLDCTLVKGERNPYNASIDRLEAGGPYSEDNVQLVCRCLNSWRSDTPLEEFIRVCTAVAVYKGNLDAK
jgi:hypothetical protein